MCGIAAVHDLSEHPDPARLADGAALGEDMLSRLHHRGPDGHGSRVVGRTWLGHTRLSIVDLDGGRQPLADAAGRRWVVANGEIYNHEELRDRLGGPFRTSSDSEVVLHVLGALGTAGIHDLRGMWAFCVADEDGRAWLGRDPLGVKPLYWARHDGRVLVASELRAFPVEVRPSVEEFPPGHVWTDTEGLHRYVDLHEDPLGGAGPVAPGFTSREDARRAIRDTLVTAVRERMMADVPVGVFLSGGLDSSVVAAILARSSQPGSVVHSFAAGTAGSGDLLAARVVADALGLEHHERVYTDEDVVAVLPAVVEATESYEPSLVRSAVPNFLLAETAAQHVKVVLTGEGADELFAGYHHLRELSEDDLRAALVDGVEALHHLNLQRCDRVTMAHGLEARVPFLSREMLAVAQRVPIAWKLLGEDGQEKRLLREAFEGWVPEEILWRRKEQFGDGSGTADAMDRVTAALVPDADWGSVRFAGLPPARTREELGYQRIFAAHLGGIRADRVLGRFATA
jgi:asparagine synthase (glutamine-hydrolysing)